MHTTILEINDSLLLDAHQDGIRITCLRGKLSESLEKKPQNNNEKKVFSLLPVLEEMEIAEGSEKELFISNDNIDFLYGKNDEEALEVESLGADLEGILPAPLPYTLEVLNNTFLASPTLAYEVRYHHGTRVVYPTRFGRFLKQGSQIYFIPKNTFELLEAIDHFNALSETDRTPETNYQYFSKIKLNGEQTDVLFSETIQKERIIVPHQVGLWFDTDAQENLYVYPEFEGLDNKKFKDAYLANETAKSVYTLPDSDGGRTRLIVSPEIQDAMNHMRKNLMGLRGEEKHRVLLKPQSVFEEVCPPETIKTSLDDFGPRVIGIGPYVYQPIPKLKENNRPNVLGDWSSGSSKQWEPVLEVVDGDGKVIDIPIKDEEAITEIKQNVQSAILENKPSVEVHTESGKSFFLPPSSQLVQGLENLSVEFQKRNKPSYKKDTMPSNKQVLIEENLDEKVYREISDQQVQEHTYEAPVSLVETLGDKKFQLKPFQKEGTAWLQANFLSKRSGVLLADDMGLGKTLQVLSFLAWLVESGWERVISDNDPLWSKTAFKERENKHPILVVTPITLLENWKTEIEKFFQHEGEVFAPVEVLSSSNIKSYLSVPPEMRGREYKTGLSSLNLEWLKKYRIIITNYDTVRNYQHSFGKVRWSVLVTDEAQAIKNPKPDVTRALKAVASNSRFKIAMTGTPIENTLLDLWCIMDFATPGLLGSAKEFRNTYENTENQTQQEAIEKLRQQLQHNQGYSSYALSRFKEDYLKDELPEKEVVEDHPFPTHFQLSPTEWQTVEELVEAGLKVQKRGKHFEVIHQLSKFYQHPALLEEDWHKYSVDDLLAKSSKYQWLYECLKHIQNRAEKALIFTRFIDAQQMILQLLGEKFGIALTPINGKVKSTARTGQSERHRILQQFKDTPGFSALILSPDVAGVGLNIVEANHVIHYGRWWNPALEDQATCRAYRLGQQRPVYVYYPISRAPVPDRNTFDETLHELLVYKSGLREDFLVPTDSCYVSEEEIVKKLYEQNAGSTQTTVTWNDIEALNGYQFEAVVSLLLRSQGFMSVTTPKSNDYGADVIAVKGQEVFLVQCKKGLPDQKVVDELLSAFDSYVQWIPRANYKISFALAFCGKNNRHVENLSRKAHKEIVLWDQRMLGKWLEKASITKSDILAEGMTRIPCKEVGKALEII